MTKAAGMRRLVVIGGIVSIASAILSAQAGPAPAHMAFDVASVKPNRSDERGSMISGPAPDRFRAINAPLDRIIDWAFGLRDEQLLGTPSWARTERFDITGKYPDGPTPNFQQVMQMVQALLVERFQLKTHEETRVGATYELVLVRRDRLGPRLKPVTIDCDAYLAQKRAAGETVRATGVGDPPLCSPLVVSDRFIKGGGRSMENLASMIARQVARPVIDRTGLTGIYEMNLEWSPDLPTAFPSADATRTPSPTDGVSLLTALQEQLGLKLEPSRGPIQVVVIDSLEHPSPD